MFRKWGPRSDTFIHASQPFKNHGSPGLVDCVFGSFEGGAESERCIRQCQSIVNRFDATQPSDACVHYRSCLKIEVPGAACIDNFQPPGLPLIAEEFDQLGERKVAEFSG